MNCREEKHSRSLVRLYKHDTTHRPAVTLVRQELLLQAMDVGPEARVLRTARLQLVLQGLDLVPHLLPVLGGRKAAGAARESECGWEADDGAERTAGRRDKEHTTGNPQRLANWEFRFWFLSKPK